MADRLINSIPIATAISLPLSAPRSVINTKRKIAWNKTKGAGAT